MVAIATCSHDGGRGARYSEARAPCAERNTLRNLYFGDLHVHTALSHETWLLGVRATTADAFRFARGEPLPIPPLEGEGAGRVARLETPLDFAAVTDHGEFLGEVEACLVPDSGAYESASCVAWRRNDALSEIVIAFPTFTAEPKRNPDICGEGRADCSMLATRVFGRVQQDAENAYDRSERCAFTSFVAYEHTGIPGASNLHRNVIFRNGVVPALPVSYFEAPRPEGLWPALADACAAAGPACQAIAIPHNSNESNGRKFAVAAPGTGTLAEQAEHARTRTRAEPLVEIFQHKGDSECMNGLSGVQAEPDPLCDFEKLRRPPFDECGDGGGFGGVLGYGCVSRLDFVRNVLVEGLAEEERLGVNPYKLGIIASTDTHNATPGAVEEDRYQGHWGMKEDTPEERLASDGLTHIGLVTNPGGLTAVWAVENSRDAIFDAFLRRETYATSGPRIAVRLFGGWDYDAGVCDSPALVEQGYARGVPMGGDLPARPAGAVAPRFAVSALREPDHARRRGTPLERIEIVKGWLDTTTTPPLGSIRVFPVAGQQGEDAPVESQSCEPPGGGFDELCTVWTDPEFRPEQRAVYYARVVERPTCRWSARECAALPPQERPASCSDSTVARLIRERAWTSPIWYVPR